jgi:hypothetical protein
MTSSDVALYHAVVDRLATELHTSRADAMLFLADGAAIKGMSPPEYARWFNDEMASDEDANAFEQHLQALVAYSAAHSEDAP